MDENIAHALAILAEDDVPIGPVNNVLAAVVDLAMPLPYNQIRNLFQIRGELKPHNENFFEITLRLYSLSDFKCHFRMTRNTMEVLHQIVAARLNPIHKINVEKKVMYTIWALAKPESFLACGDRFGFSTSTAQMIYEQIVSVIAECVDDYIVWPNLQQQLQIAEIFRERSHGFPGIVGAIDGTHISIVAPRGNANDYYNRYQSHSMILQAVCDHQCRFINISTGYPGRMHDARVFRISPIGQELLDDPALRIPHPDHHLLGDSAYGLAPYLLTPYKDNGHLNPRQTNYNTKFSSVRATIERSFGRLKGKFRRLKLLELYKLELISKTIVASCVTHNLIINNEGLSEDEYSDDEGVEEDEDVIIGAHRNNAGDAKRNAISAMLN